MHTSCKFTQCAALSHLSTFAHQQEDGRGEHEPVHFDPFPDLPADFGPEVPDEGIDGLLLVRTSEMQQTSNQGRTAACSGVGTQ